MKKKQIIQLKTKDDQLRAATIVSEQIPNMINPPEVVIREPTLTRSDNQNRLYWAWVGLAANLKNEIKDDIHQQWKKKYLLPILRRDDEEFNKIFAPLRRLWDIDKESALHMYNQISKLTSTTQLSVKQMQEYMNEIQLDMAREGIDLPDGDDFRKGTESGKGEQSLRTGRRDYR
jgi:hypothetical protein